jgi:hypothetical protein
MTTFQDNSTDMDEQNERISGGEKTPEHVGREIPFDATTRFSLLGWVWDKFNKAIGSKKIIDLNLED